ncbi:MAG TPA: site-specific DNA-methyltransferase, partial [Bryobacteraceae bacterium]|nr:site-specific DNA-methyltransferase [Bryobacteraceae bacterium]
VVETQYCITLDRIFAIEDEGTRDWLVEQIIQNDAQREEWVRLFAIDTFKGDLTTPGYTEPLKPEFLKAHPTLVVDTRHFDEAFKLRLLAAIPDIDEETDGLLIHSENFQALNLLKERYRTQVKCVYIDPPFNTGGDFPYKDSFRNSSWIELFWDRLNVSLPIFSPEGNYFIHLDHNAIHYGKLLFEMTFPEINELIFNTNATKDEESGLFSYKSFGQKFVRQHDTILHGYNSTINFVKLWKPNRNTSRLDLGQLDLISRGKVSTPRSLEDFEFYIEKYQDGTLVEHIVDRGEEKIFPIGDIWNDLYSFTQSEMRVSENLSFRTQKPENLVRRIIQTCTVPGDLVLDFFAGSGTTPAVSHKLRRKYIGVEMGDYFETTYQEYDATSKTWIEKLGILGRMKNVLHGDVAFKACGKDRRSTLSKEIGWAGGGMFKYIRLESYEDTLNNLELKRTEAQQSLLEKYAAFREDYMLHYMLDVESRGSASLLNIDRFEDPFNYKLNIATGTVGETKPTVVDLVETFNYLIGLRVKTMDDVRGVRVVTGLNPQGERVLILWRKTKELDNDALDEWFRKQGYNTKDQEYDVIYVNGDNNLENLRKADQTWKVRLIEEEFQRLMFDVADV